MGEIRKYTRRQRWTENEIALLYEKYAHLTREELGKFFPNRNIRTLESKANGLGLKRQKKEARSLNEIRKAKRESMAKRRVENPELVRKYGRDYHANNREKQTKNMRDYYARRFFWGRAMKLRGSNKANFKQLASIWKKQRGLCGLTGRKLDKTAQLDHIIPKAKGGEDSIDNLRWVCEEANLARRALSDEQFVSLCSDVMAWIGGRIAAYLGRDCKV